MKHAIVMTVLIVAFSCSTSKTDQKPTASTQEETASATSPIEDAETIRELLDSGNTAGAYELLRSGNIPNTLDINKNIVMWYVTEPNFFSWFVSESKIEEGPSYFSMNQLVQKDLTGDSEGKELLIYATHQPYTYVDAFAFAENPEHTNFLGRKILQTQFNGAREDEVITVEPDPEGPNYGITEGFEIKQDVHKILSYTKFPPINPDLLASESKPYTVSSYYKFYAADLEEAERVLSGDEQHLKDLLDTLDVRNGYMRVILPADGHFYTKEYVYWNLSDGRKLFAFNQIESDFIDNTYTSSFEFRAFNDGKWEPFDIGVLKDLMNDTARKTGDALQGTDLADQVFPGDEIAQVVDFVIRLPQSGKAISLTFMHAADEESTTPFKTVQLTFNDGKFEYQP